MSNEAGKDLTIGSQEFHNVIRRCAWDEGYVLYVLTWAQDSMFFWRINFKRPLVLFQRLREWGKWLDSKFLEVVIICRGGRQHKEPWSEYWTRPRMRR
nr:hypothetical protein CFP56_53583 [Quercus suber]